MDPQNPNVMYAGIWQFQRRPWTFTSGGPHDGLYKSTDGGKTWTKLTGHGLPAGTTGRIGLAVAPSNGKRVYALIESKDGILWRSDDGGDDWTMVSKNTLVDQRPFYFTHIAVDPKNPDRVYGVSEALSESKDGGKTFKEIADGVHVDYHAIWIAPNDPTRIMVGEDGGYALTLDGGDNWFFSANLPIGANLSRRASTEKSVLGVRRPARQQRVVRPVQLARSVRHSKQELDRRRRRRRRVGRARSRRSQSASGPIRKDGALGHLQPRRRKTAWFVAAVLQTSLETFDIRAAQVSLQLGVADRVCTVGPAHRVATAATCSSKRSDRGAHWTVISPDLTRNVKDHQQPSGGPITHDVSGAERPTRSSTSKARRCAKARSGSAPTTASFNSRATAASTGRT